MVAVPLSKYRYRYIGTVSGPTSYTTGGFTVTIGRLRSIVWADVRAGGGYKAEVSWTGNTLTVLVRQCAGVAGPLAEVSAGTDLSGVTFILEVEGH